MILNPLKHGRLRNGSSEEPLHDLQDSIPLSQLRWAPALQDPLNEGRPGSKAVFKDVEMNPEDHNQRAHNYWRLLCYFLHAFLVALHLVLLALAASHHVENQVIIPMEDVASFDTRLRVGLQAFYTLYTAVLVFMAQRLTLSAIFSSPKKLTQIHDTCGAWAGFGAALSALWQQTKVASSVLPIILVTIYFACVSALHVTSSTLMHIQPVNHSMTRFNALESWPGPSVNLTSLDWMGMTPLVPFLHFLYSGFPGLANNTLYDDLELGFFTITVHATTLKANCGLLSNISIGSLENNTWNVNASMSGLDPSITFSYSPLFNEIWLSPSIQCLEPICSTLILFVVSAEMEVDDPAGSVNHVFINRTYYSSGNDTTQNVSIPIYFVACSLNSTNHTITLDSSTGLWVPLGAQIQPANATWSTFLPAGDPNLTSAISYIMKSANSLPSSSYCQPGMSYPALWANITAFNVYLRSALGIGVSSCPGMLIADSEHANNPSLLTRSQFEGNISKIAAELIWLAGQVGSSGGGFDRQSVEYPILVTTPLWSLNINFLPVIFALCTSVILLVLVIYFLWQCPPTVVSGAGLLEILWFGSRSQVLRGRFRAVKTASLDSLRASATFKTIFWTRAGGNLSVDVPLYGVGTDARSPGAPGFLESENQHPSDLSQRRSLHTPNIFLGTLCWCYTLHVLFVALHVALLALLVHHPEHSVAIPWDADSETLTVLAIGLSALLQAIYTIFTAPLVFLMQRLALLKITSGRRKLTTVHDVSAAWTGVGAAIHVLWKQYKASSSILEIITAAYLTMMLVLHITSSSIMGWQDYRFPSNFNIPMNLAMPNSDVNISQLVWADIFPVVDSIQQAGAWTPGILNSTIYDVAVPYGAQSPSAVVNATTFTAQCGLVANLTLSYSSEGEYLISFQNGTNNGSFLESPIWKDIIHVISPITECISCPQTLFYLVTTDIEVDESVHDPVAVELDWTYTSSEEGNSQTSTTLTYIAACSLNAQTVVAPIVNIFDDQTPSPTSIAWSVWLPENATNLSVGMAMALSRGATGSFPMFFQGDYSANFTDMDSFIMSMLGLNLTYANETSVSQSSANPSVALTPWQLENAIAQIAAMFMWTAGMVGADWGGFQPSPGQSYVASNETVLRLHAYAIPIIVASIASLVSLILAITVIGKGPSREHPTSISGTSVLECLWLEAHSELLHSRLQMVEEPCLDKLRAAGMFDICLGDVGHPEAEQLIPEVADE